MVKGMSATQTIVALAVGLIVIVGLGYLVWTWLGRGGGQVDEQFCRTKILAYCTRDSDRELDGFFNGQNSKCEVHRVAITEGFSTCQELLGLGN